MAVCVCVCVVGGAPPAILLPKTNFLCADLCLCLCCQLVRPVTVVPNVPGIPGPPSPQPQAQPQPQPAQSEAKLVFVISSFTSNVISMLRLVISHLKEIITSKVMRELDDKETVPTSDLVRELEKAWVSSVQNYCQIFNDNLPFIQMNFII